MFACTPFPQVLLTPLDDNDELLTHFETTAYYTGTTDPQLPCGCNGGTGTPTSFGVRQFKGHILFRWADESQCESAFTFTRNGVGLASRFDVTEQQACGAVQEPLSISDDLTIQSRKLCVACAACAACVLCCVCGWVWVCVARWVCWVLGVGAVTQCSAALRSPFWFCASSWWLR